MYALVDINGKQYKAVEGAMLKVEKVNFKLGDKVVFNSVMLLRDGENVKIGKPYVGEAKVECTYKEDKRDSKVIAYKYKRRKDYERKVGHRQEYSYLLVEKISS